jgi:hypothetical protein
MMLLDAVVCARSLPFGDLRLYHRLRPHGIQALVTVLRSSDDVRQA